MSFGGYSDRVSNVGGGFLSILIDMGDEKKCGSALAIIPIGILFFLLSCYGIMLGIIGFNTAAVYTTVMFFFLTMILRMERKVETHE